MRSIYQTWDNNPQILVVKKHNQNQSSRNMEKNKDLFTWKCKMAIKMSDQQPIWDTLYLTCSFVKQCPKLYASITSMFFHVFSCLVFIYESSRWWQYTGAWPTAVWTLGVVPITSRADNECGTSHTIVLSAVMCALTDLIVVPRVCHYSSITISKRMSYTICHPGTSCLGKPCIHSIIHTVSQFIIV